MGWPYFGCGGVKMKKRIDAYEEILDVLTKHESLLRKDYSINIINKIRDRIEVEKLSEEFGIKMGSKGDADWCKLSAYASVGRYGPNRPRKITRPDNGKQPMDETLYCLYFPMGGFVFSHECFNDLFNEFFEKLKTYEPKYIDTLNHALYFTSENAKYVHQDFKGIFEAYKAKALEEIRLNKIKKLEEELKLLRGIA
jgi:hypothetical protein